MTGKSISKQLWLALICFLVFAFCIIFLGESDAYAAEIPTSGIAISGAVYDKSDGCEINIFKESP